MNLGRRHCASRRSFGGGFPPPARSGSMPDALGLDYMLDATRAEHRDDARTARDRGVDQDEIGAPATFDAAAVVKTHSARWRRGHEPPGGCERRHAILREAEGRDQR